MRSSDVQGKIFGEEQGGHVNVSTGLPFRQRLLRYLRSIPGQFAAFDVQAQGRIST